VGPGADRSSVVSGGRLVRWTDKALGTRPLEAERLVLTERLYAPFSAGDVRISPFVGGVGTAYFDRSDGGDDVVRGALEAGVRANLELHRDFAAYGGPWALDGLRHTIDLDAGFYARFADTGNPGDVPALDVVETERDRTEAFLEARTRTETRRVVTGPGGKASVRENATLFDASVRVSLWPESVGPYGKTGPGEVQAWVRAEVLPRKMWVRADSVSSLERSAFEHSSVGVEYTPNEDLDLSAGIRHVHAEDLAPWFDGYWRWNEKWGVRLEALKDFERARADSLRLVLLRFSPDHIFDFGITVRHGGNDLGVVFDVLPAIGGDPLKAPYEPHDQVAREP